MNQRQLNLSANYPQKIKMITSDSKPLIFIRSKVREVAFWRGPLRNSSLSPNRILTKILTSDSN